jgi:hypothetical protein
LNWDPSRPADNARFVVNNGYLYLTWVENESVRAALYNGNDSKPSWTNVDGNAVRGILHDPTQMAQDAVPYSFNNKIYLMWAESNKGGVLQIRAVEGH